MLYTLLKYLSRLTLWGYFRQIHVEGKHHIPKNGPYIFIANHPSTFMDPIVVANVVSPQLYFIAAGEYVGTGLKGWIFKHILHMIPVFRPGTRPKDTHKNADMFTQCHDHLGQNGALLIFPEGVSITEKRIKPLKTGAVRIAVGTENKYDFKKNVAIIPIGLNYTNPHDFRSDLHVKIGEPVYVNQVLTNAEKTDKTAQVEAVKRITLDLEETLQNLTIHTEQSENEVLLDRLAVFFENDWGTEENATDKSLPERFEIRQNLIKGIEYFKINDFNGYQHVSQQIDEYLKLLKKANTSDQTIALYQKRNTVLDFSFLVLGFPLFLIGWIHNYLPYRFTGWLTDSIKIDATFNGSLRLTIGLFVFLLWYIGLTIAAFFAGLSWYALFYPVLMYTTGIFALIYAGILNYAIAYRRFKKRLKSLDFSIFSLIQKRKEIEQVLKKYQEKFEEISSATH